MVDFVIVLYDQNERQFQNNGFGTLTDATECTVTEERNGEFELEMVYPVSGKHYEDIELRRIIFCKPNPFDEPEPFRIYAISKPIDGLVTINAEHISYDLTGYPAYPFSIVGSTTATDAIAQLGSASVFPSSVMPFTFYTDLNKTCDEELIFSKTQSIRSILGGDETDSILGRFGGEFKFSRFRVQLLTNRGSDSGVVIRYGKNLTEISHDENVQEMFTGVYPYYYKSDSGMTDIRQPASGQSTNPYDYKVVRVPNTNADFTKILPVDLTNEFDDLEDDTLPTDDQLREAALKYIEENKVGIPKLTVDISFIDLSSTTEYVNLVGLEKVRLCDMVGVEYPQLGVSVRAKCIKTEYNVITNAYNSITLGDVTSLLSSTLSSVTEIQNETKTQIRDAESWFETYVDDATEAISGNAGGHVVLYDANNDGKPDELLIMERDKLSMTEGKLWRWNLSGLAFSSSGYNGPYGQFAIDMVNGRVLANDIVGKSITGYTITGGTIEMGGSNLSTAGTFNIYDEHGNPHITGNTDGIHCYNQTGGVDSQDARYTTLRDAELCIRNSKYVSPYTDDVVGYFGSMLTSNPQLIDVVINLNHGVTGSFFIGKNSGGSEQNELSYDPLLEYVCNKTNQSTDVSNDTWVFWKDVDLQNNSLRNVLFNEINVGTKENPLVGDTRTITIGEETLRFVNGILVPNEETPITEI